MHWRRFATSSIPVDDPKQFEQWLLERWREKDELLEYYVEHGLFPADGGAGPLVNGGKPVTRAGYIETEVRPRNPVEWMQIFVPPAALLLVVNVVIKIFRMVLRVLRIKTV